MAIKQIFPRTVLILGLVSIFLVWMPIPGQCDTCQQLYEGEYNPEWGWWHTQVSSNPATGECTLTATEFLSTETGPLIIQVRIKANDTTGAGSKDITYVSSDGTWSEHYEGQDNNWPLTSTTETKSDGSKKITKYEYGNERWNFWVSSVTSSDGKGSELTVTYDSNGHMISSVEKQANGYVYSTTCDRDGNCTSTTYYDGKAVAKSAIDGKTGEETVYTCINGKCHSTRAAGDYSGAGTEDPSTGVQGKSTKPKGIGGAELKLKDEVLGQIEGKPRGDLGARERVTTGVLDQSKVGALQVKPKAEDLAGAKARVPTGLGDRFKKTPGEAVGLNPQPLPPDPPPDRLGGKAGFDKKLQTGVVQPFKEKANVQGSTLGQKEKLSVTPRSQSAGQMQSQSSGAAKQKVQTQAVQPFKAKTQIQDFRSPAGSSGAYPGLR